MLAEVMELIKPRSYPRVYAPKASPTSAFRSMRVGAMSAPIYHEDASVRDSFSIERRRLTDGDKRGMRRNEIQKGHRVIAMPRSLRSGSPAFTAPCRNQTVDSTIHKARDMPSPFQPELSNLLVDRDA